MESILTCLYSRVAFRVAPYHAPVAVMAAMDAVKTYLRARSMAGEAVKFKT